MYKILVTDGMDKKAVATLIDAGFEVVEEFYEPEVLAEKIKGFDALVVRSATKVRQPIIDAALETKRLKLVIRAGVGVDNIDVNYALERGIEVRNTPNASSDSVAELAIAHMFALARFVNISNVTMRNGEWNKKQYKGIELNGKTLGLVGFGRIANSLEKKATALGMNVIYTDVSGPKEGYAEGYRDKDALLKESDFLSLHIPFIKENGAYLGEEEFNAMKDGMYLINAARGGVVCEKALLDALNAGKVAGAGIDVFEEEPTKNDELINHPRVSVTPHIGASTKEAQARIGLEVLHTIFKFFEN